MPLLIGWCEKNSIQGLFPDVCLKRRIRHVCADWGYHRAPLMSQTNISVSTCLPQGSPAPHCHPWVGGSAGIQFFSLGMDLPNSMRRNMGDYVSFQVFDSKPTLSHSENCRVNSKREQLDMWMGGGGCSPKVCLASTVCDWLDWLSYLGLGRFKIPRSDCLAGCNEPCWYKCEGTQLPWSVLSPPSLTQLHNPAYCRVETAFSSLLCALPSRSALARFFGGGGSRGGGEEGQAS